MYKKNKQNVWVKTIIRILVLHNLIGEMFISLYVIYSHMFYVSFMMRPFLVIHLLHT